MRLVLNRATPRTDSTCAGKLTAPIARLASQRPLATTLARLAHQCLVPGALTRKTSAVIVDGANEILADDVRTPLVTSSAIAMIVAKEKSEHAHNQFSN